MNPNVQPGAEYGATERSLALDVLASPDLLAKVLEFPRGEATTYGATPLDRMITLEQQVKIKSDLVKSTYHIPDNVPIEIADHVHSSFGKRFDNRGEANDENFVTSLMYERQNELDPLFQEMIQRGRTGQASPAELLVIRSVMGIRSVELACLTHAYGANIEMLEDMRDSIDHAVELFGGETIDNPTPHYAFKESIGEETEAFDPKKMFDPTFGFLVTRKRTLATMPDGTVIRERSSFIFRTDSKSFLPYAIREAIDAIDPQDNEWRAKLEQIDGLSAYIAELLASNEYAYAIPVSTTTYAFNKDTTTQVEAHAVSVAAEREQARIAPFKKVAHIAGYSIEDMDNSEVQAYYQSKEAEIEAARKRAYDEMPIFGQTELNNQLKKSD